MTRTAKVAVSVALLVALVSAFLPWFVVSTPGLNSTQFNLIDAYNFFFNLLNAGSSSSLSSVFSSGLGAAIANGQYSGLGPVLPSLAGLAFVLLFWPISLISGLREVLGFRIRAHPALFGFVCVLAGYFFVESVTGMSIGVGLILEAVASIVLLVAFFIPGQRARSLRMAQTRKTVTPLTIEQGYACQQCGARFDSSAALSSHISIAHPSTAH